MKALLIGAIRAYKRHLSPRKGYACAYRVHTGGCSCSTLGLRAISRYGAWRGLGVLRLRLEQCRLVAREHRAPAWLHHATQAGSVDCDIPCDASCDLPSCDLPSCGAADDACEIAACFDWGGCGGSSDDAGGGGSGGANANGEGESRHAVRGRRRRGDPPSGEAPPDAGGAEL